MSQDEPIDVLPVNLKEAIYVAQVHLVKNDPVIRKCLTDLAQATERLESMDIPAWMIEQVFISELRESRFSEMARESLDIGWKPPPETPSETEGFFSLTTNAS